MARTKREVLCYPEEPLMEPELRTKEKRILKFRTEDSEDEDVSKTPHHQTRKNERMQK